MTNKLLAVQSFRELSLAKPSHAAWPLFSQRRATLGAKAVGFLHWSAALRAKTRRLFVAGSAATGDQRFEIIIRSRVGWANQARTAIELVG